MTWFRHICKPRRYLRKSEARKSRFIVKRNEEKEDKVKKKNTILSDSRIKTRKEKTVETRSEEEENIGSGVKNEGKWEKRVYRIGRQSFLFGWFWGTEIVNISH